jgi:hypothetical protein
MFRIFAMLSFLPDLVGVRAPRYFCFTAAPIYRGAELAHA